MEWVFIIGAVFVVLAIFGVKAENKKNKIKVEQRNAYSADIEAAKQSLMTSFETASMPVFSAADYGYRLPDVSAYGSN